MVTPGESVDRHSLTERWLPSRGHESAAIGPRAFMECHSGLEETPQDPVDVLHLNFECEPKYLSRLHILDRSVVWRLARRMNDRDVPDTVTSMVEVDGPHPLQS